MKISYNWLKTLIDIDLPPEVVAEKLTNVGLEVESIEVIESVKGGFNGLVVGEVMSCEKHPDADKLKCTKVNVGSDVELDIVCGAPNVAQGQKVVVALVNTMLYPSTGEPFKIKKSKIRGAVSEGMLCAEDEIGLGASHDGIIVLDSHHEVGTPISKVYKIENDVVFEIGLTPNRSDAASHYGVARDLAAIINSESENFESTLEPRIQGLEELPEASGTTKVEIKLKNTDACKRYSGLVINGVEVKDSPDWIKQRLNAIGVRPINNVVDITNFVLHELGQPLHAFDLDKINGKQIIIDLAKDGDKFVTLDNVERTLKSNDLMISNVDEHMCLAGIFGGTTSGVTENTKAIFLESAYFDPGFIRKSAKTHGLKTDSSFRFERGTDPEMTTTALVRAANLILEIAGGSISMELTDIYPVVLEPFKVALSFSECADLIGQNIDKTIIKRIISSLGIKIINEGSDSLLLEVPRFKSDVSRPVDVIEEILRIYGYNKINPASRISYSIFESEKNYDRILEERIGSFLTANGFFETMNLSLNKKDWYVNQESLVNLINPLSSDLNVLRENLLFGGVVSLSYNINRKTDSLRFYEIGNQYSQNKTEEGTKYLETKKIGLWLSGSLYEENAFGLEVKSDVLVMKNILESLLNKIGIELVSVEPKSNEWYSSGLDLTVNKKIIGEIGQVSNKLLKQFDIKQTVVYAELDWNSLKKLVKKNKTEYQAVSLYPAVKRDLALLLEKTVKFQDLKEAAKQVERKLLQEVELFDVYEDAKLGDKKSYALRFTLQDSDATLTDKQIEKVMEKITTTYKDKFKAELR